MNLRLSSSILLFALSVPVFAGHAAVDTATNQNKLYMGILGGGGSSGNFNGNMFGTAFMTEANGGPLAVDSFGHIRSQSSSFFGIQLGYQAHEIALSQHSPWTVTPAAELEGLSMNNSTFKGEFINDTMRIPEHDFLVSYPMSRNVFLANAVLSFNHASLMFHPYVGFGVGGAVIRITNADATQISPPEAGLNHYNTSTNANNSTFAGQIKVGLSYDINSYVSVFADYRWVYLASTEFTFGSTVAAGHVETSSWNVNFDAERNNMGNIGVRFNI